MSGDVTYQALKRLTFLPDREERDNGNVIAGQEYYDVYFTGGQILNVTLTDVVINGVNYARAETIVSDPGDYNVAPTDYVVTLMKTIPEATTVTLPVSPTLSRSIIIKDGSGNAGTFNITIDANGGMVDGQSSFVLSRNYDTIELIYNGTEWNVLNKYTEDLAGFINQTVAPDLALKQDDIQFQNNGSNVSTAGAFSTIDFVGTGVVLTDMGGGVLEAAISGSGGVVDGNYVDITVSAGGTVWTINNGAVDNAKIAAGVDAAKIADGSVSNTEFQYINSLTSNAQTQIDGKQATITGAATTITSSNLTASRAVISNGSGKIDVSPTTSTELSYVNGVTSAIQTQLNGKQPLDATLTALAAYNTNGILTQTAADTFTGRTITGTANEVTVSSGDGVSGNPTISLPADINLSGKTTLLVPYNASPTISSNGAFAYDSTVTNWSHGIPRGYAGESLDYVVMPTANMASPTDRQAVIYDSAAQENKYDTVGPVLSATQATTSGTFKDFTGIPSWARKIIVNISGVSTNGTSIPIIQVGTSGGPDTSGYLGASVAIQSGTAQANLSSGLLLDSAWAATNVIHGVIVFTMLEASTNTWAFTGSVGRSDTARVSVVSGSKSTLNPVDRIRITTVAGVDNFDAGKVSITYQ